jgi:plasmid stabilization system protein ParE
MLRAFMLSLYRKSRCCATRYSYDQQGVKSLGAHPEVGRPVDEMPPEFREWFVQFGSSGYVVLYRYDGSRVAILAVRHGREAGY